MAMTGRPPRCRACGGHDNVTQVAVSLLDWAWLHSSCAESYVRRDKPKRQIVSESTASVFAHPLMKHRRGGPILGYIRSNNPPTDAQGWMPLSSST